MHTEAEAKKLACCQGAELPKQRGPCIASTCMAWRWAGRDDGDAIATSRGHIPKSEAGGYCGIAGRPAT